MEIKVSLNKIVQICRIMSKPVISMICWTFCRKNDIIRQNERRYYMRTALLKKQVQEYYKLLKLEIETTSSNGNAYKRIKNWKEVNYALHQLNKFDFIGESIENIFELGENFIASTDVTAILDKNYNKFINMFDIVKAKCEAIIDVDYGNDKIENEEDCIYIKLPNNLTELDKLTDIVKGLDITFNQCPILRDTYDRVNFEGVDVGSSWLIISFIITASPFVGKTLNYIADFIKKCNNIRIQNRTIKKMDLEYLLEKSKLDAQEKEKVIKDIKEKIEEESREDCIKSFKSISIPLDRQLTPEEEGKITHCMLTLSELLELGIELYPSINSSDELKLAFPKKEEWKKIEGEIKLLENNEK